MTIQVRVFYWLLPLLFLCVAGARSGAEETFPREFEDISLETLPPVGMVIQRAMDELPKNVTERQNWLKRMRWAALLPEVELRYITAEDAYRQYQVLDRQEIRRESESVTFSESGSLSGSETGVEEEYVSALSSYVPDSRRDFSSTESESVSGSESSRSTVVIDQGRDSYETGEGSRWMDEYGVFLTWDLSKFIFQGEDEIRAADTQASLAEFRLEYIDDIVDFYADLKEALVHLRDVDPNSSRMQIQKLTSAAKLDAMTNHFLSHYVILNSRDTSGEGAD